MTDRDADTPTEPARSGSPRAGLPQTDPVPAGARTERPGPDRRGLLRTGLATGAVTALGLAAAAPAGAAHALPDRTITLSGHLPTGAPDFVLLPFDVPDGVREIAVSYSYDRPTVLTGTPGNSCDIGLFDEGGTELGGRGFRGWSGGFRTEFTVARDRATPGYLPGPIRPGRWNIVLGPYQVAPQGLDYRVQVTLRFGPPGPEFTPSYPPERARGRGRAWYRGDSHLHTVHSDGQPAPGGGGGGCPGGRAGLHRLHRPQHHLRARRLGAAGRAGPVDRARRGGHHPQRPLAGAGPGAGPVRRLALPGARRGVPALRPAGPPPGRPGGARAPVLPVRRLPVEVRLPGRGRGRGLERTVDVRRRVGGGHLGRTARGRAARGAALAAYCRQQRRAQRPAGHRLPAHRRPGRGPHPGGDPRRAPGLPQLAGRIGRLSGSTSPPPGRAARRASANS